jgi:Na+/pantothenate symporter
MHQMLNFGGILIQKQKSEEFNLVALHHRKQIFLYLVAMVAMGRLFKKNKASGDYFLGGRQFGWFALCMSAMATQLSVISFVSAPAFVGLRQGGGMKWLTFEFGVPLAMIIVMVIIAPATWGKTGFSTARKLDLHKNLIFEVCKNTAYKSSLSHSATPFVLVEKTTPTPVIGTLRRRKLAA